MNMINTYTEEYFKAEEFDIIRIMKETEAASENGESSFFHTTSSSSQDANANYTIINIKPFQSLFSKPK